MNGAQNKCLLAFGISKTQCLLRPKKLLMIYPPDRHFEKGPVSGKRSLAGIALGSFSDHFPTLGNFSKKSGVKVLVQRHFVAF
jgi:hypothetical protein